LEHDLFRNRYPPHSASEDARERAYDARRKTRVNALMIKSGAGFFGIMR
jgi:hypothetical protein